MFSTTAYCQYTPLGADAYGRANTAVSSILYGAFYHNVATMASLNQNYIQCNYFRSVPVEGFQTLGLLVKKRIKHLHLGLGIDSFGDKYYRESRIGLATAIKKDKVSMGVKFSYLNTGIIEYSSRGTILGEFGILTSPTKKLNIGLQLYNFTQAKLYQSSDFPTRISIGAEYTLATKVKVATQYNHNFGFEKYFTYSVAYKASEALNLCTGINPSLKSIHFGIEFAKKPYVVQLGTATNTNIGLSNQISLIKLIR